MRVGSQRGGGDGRVTRPGLTTRPTQSHAPYYKDALQTTSTATEALMMRTGLEGQPAGQEGRRR